MKRSEEVKEFLNAGTRGYRSLMWQPEIKAPIKDILFNLFLALLLLGANVLQVVLSLWQLVIALLMLGYAAVLRLMRTSATKEQR